jgi:hypothetical protein
MTSRHRLKCCSNMSTALVKGDGEWATGLFYNKKKVFDHYECDGDKADINRPIYVGEMDTFPAIRYCPWCGNAI